MADTTDDYRTRYDTHAIVRLTLHERETLAGLLVTVLTNGDQWQATDLAALRRVADKL